MRSRIILVVVLAGLATAFGCASSGRSSDGEFITRNILTSAQIAETAATNAYEAVERLKSHWLRIRGTSAMPPAGGVARFEENPILVYMDDQRLGGIEELRRIEIAVVKYIRYYSPAEASARWGFNHGGGVIYVSSRPLSR